MEVKEAMIKYIPNEAADVEESARNDDGSGSDSDRSVGELMHINGLDAEDLIEMGFSREEAQEAAARSGAHVNIDAGVGTATDASFHQHRRLTLLPTTKEHSKQGYARHRYNVTAVLTQLMGRPTAGGKSLIITRASTRERRSKHTGGSVWSGCEHGLTTIARTAGAANAEDCQIQATGS